MRDRQAVIARMSLIPQSLEVLYRDAFYVAVNKPAGQFVHRTQLDRGAEQVCLQQLRDQIGQTVWPCHRLDRPTSGVLLFGLSEEATSRIALAFAEGRIEKEYRALVRGWVEEGGRVDYPIRAERDERSHPPREAVTDYAPLNRFTLAVSHGGHEESRFTQVALWPRTGRRHQLRRHMAHLRHPIVGDSRHGDGAVNRLAREHMGTSRLMLVAVKLAFAHPYTGAVTTISCDPAADYAAALAALKSRA